MLKTLAFKKVHVVNATVFTGADLEDDKDTKNVNAICYCYSQITFQYLGIFIVFFSTHS